MEIKMVGLGTNILPCHSPVRTAANYCCLFCAFAVPTSGYLLVSDMDGVKMVSVDGSDQDSVYVAAVGRPFASNLVALAYDSASNTAYYSDVRRYPVHGSINQSTNQSVIF